MHLERYYEAADVYQHVIDSAAESNPRRWFRSRKPSCGSPEIPGGNREQALQNFPHFR